MNNQVPRPSTAFVGASWAALLLGSIVYLAGLWNAKMQLNEKGFYFALLAFGLFAVISLQKSVRDRIEGIRVSDQYYSLCWVATGVCLVLMAAGLFNATLTLSEKGFFGLAFVMCVFGAIVVQKNTRDLQITGDARASEDD